MGWFGAPKPYFNDPDYRRHEKNARKLTRQGRHAEAAREERKSDAAYGKALKAWRSEMARRMPGVVLGTENRKEARR